MYCYDFISRKCSGKANLYKQKANPWLPGVVVAGKRRVMK